MSNLITNNQTSIDSIETDLVRDVLTSCCAVANTKNTSRYSTSPRKGKTLHVFKILSSDANIAACASAIEQLKHHGAEGWELFHGTSKAGNVVGIKKIS